MTNYKCYMLKFRLFAFFILLASAILAWGNISASSQVTDKTSTPIVLAAYGDSLSAGYQLPKEAAFPCQLEAALRQRGHNVTVLNISVSGDTASAGLARLEWSLQDNVDGLILELGANDALRGIDPKITKQALEQMIKKLKERKISILLAGMRAPPNLGPDYGSRFNEIYPELATKHDILLYPFFLDGVAAMPNLNLADGIHPTEEGVRIIVKRILPSVEALLDKIKSRT